MTLQKSNVVTNIELVVRDSSQIEERHVLAAAEVGVGSANQSPAEVLNVREVCNFKKTSEGYTVDGKEYVYLSPHEGIVENSDTNLFVSIRKNHEIKNNTSPQTQLTSNALYLLTQGSMEISYESGERETLSAFVGENWSSEYPNYRYSVNCIVELHKNSSLFVVDLLNPVSNYDIEHIQFNGVIEKSLDSNVIVIAKCINTSPTNNLVYVNDELCRSYLICNGNISLNSSGNAISVLIKNKQ